MLKPKCGEIGGKPLIPSSRSLLEAIERFAETANIIWVIAIPKARWLVHKYCLLKVPMKKSIFNIKLMNGPGLTKSQREHSADGGGFTTGLKVSSQSLTILTSTGRGTSSHVSFLIKAFNSSVMATFQLGS